MMNRRSFLRVSLGTAGTLMFPWAEALAGRPRTAWDPGAEPHFFLQVVFSGGMDPTYLFDARPMAMTQAGIIQNYLKEEPVDWVGSNGGRARSTRLVSPLLPYRDRFSVLNGVHMALGFDGHDQNMNFLFAGDPFGGESFVPHLNRLSPGTPSPLDAVTAGALFANLTNGGATVPLNPDSAKKIVGRLAKSSPMAEADPLFAFVQGRMKAVAAGSGAFARGAAAMARAYAQTPQFSARLSGLKIGDPPPSGPGNGGMVFGPQTGNGDMDPRFLDMCAQFFRLGISRSAVFVSNGDFDAHDAKTASGQPEAIGRAAQVLADVFKGLSSIPYDEQRSFLDVTTVLASSEFGRTLRQPGRPIDKTGTDHNPLSNTILIGGKGIRGGQVFGASDTSSVGETLSKAHLAFDPPSVKMMGRPFDFVTGRVRQELPDTYKATDYLGMASVANTLYSLFGVSSSHFRLTMRNGPVALPIPGLLI